MAETKEELQEMVENSFQIIKNQRLELTCINFNEDGFIDSFFLNELPFIYSDADYKYICFI